MKPTKTDQALAEAERDHAGDPARAEMIHRARTFKASWLELAEALTHVRRGGQWKRWGHASFEEYAQSELRLRRETVEKLTGSFQFLQRRAPEVLSRDGVAEPIPSYQSIDFLRRAESQEGAPAETLRALRDRVIDQAAPLSAVARQFKSAVFPVDETDARARDRAALANVGGKLHDLLAETTAVPKKLASEIRASVARLLAALEESREGDAPRKPAKTGLPSDAAESGERQNRPPTGSKSA